MKNQQYLLLAVVLGIALLGGLFIYRNRQTSSISLTESQYENEIQVSAPEDAIDQETGEVDQAAFEENQKISSDNSLDTLEEELNETVILEEDFSDL